MREKRREGSKGKGGRIEGKVRRSEGKGRERKGKQTGNLKRQKSNEEINYNELRMSFVFLVFFCFCFFVYYLLSWITNSLHVLLSFLYLFFLPPSLFLFFISLYCIFFHPFPPPSSLLLLPYSSSIP